MKVSRGCGSVGSGCGGGGGSGSRRPCSAPVRRLLLDGHRRLAALGGDGLGLLLPALQGGRVLLRLIEGVQRRVYQTDKTRRLSDDSSKAPTS